MGEQKTTGELWWELLVALVMLAGRAALAFSKAALIVIGPSIIVGLIILPFVHYPSAPADGLENAVIFTSYGVLILAWLWFIIVPLVDDLLLPYRYQDGSVGTLARWVSRLAG